MVPDMRAKGGSILIRSILEAALLLVAGAALAMGLFQLAGFRGMEHHYRFADTAKSAAGWSAAKAGEGHSAKTMEPSGAGMGTVKTRIGEAKADPGIVVTASYAQPGSNPNEILLEAEIVAAADNKVGLRAGEFVPNLSVKCSLVNLKTGEKIERYLCDSKDEFTGLRCYEKKLEMSEAGDYALSLSIAPSTVVSSDEVGKGEIRRQKPVVVGWKFAFMPGKLKN